jgi:hypothetical protein
MRCRFAIWKWGMYISSKVRKTIMSKSELENVQTLLSRNEIRPQINYQTIVLLPLMTTLIFYQTLIWSHS